MKFRTFVFIVFLALVAVGIGFVKYRLVKPAEVAHSVVSATATATPAPTPLATPSPKPDPVVAVFQTLTPAQKIAQMIAMPLKISSASATLTQKSANTALQISPGFITIFGENLPAKTVQTTIAQMKIATATTSAVPTFFGVDHEGGQVQRLSGAGFTILPSWQGLCAGDPTIETTTLTRSATELSQVGINFVLGPDADVGANNVFLGDRICATDPQIVTQHAQNWLNIFQQHHIMSILKHYPGIGDGDSDPHKKLEKIAFNPASEAVFTTLLKQSSQSAVMVAHVISDDASPSAQPCSLNANCAGKLRNDFPQTLLFTDALQMSSATPKVTGPALAITAEKTILAGEDVLIFDPTLTLKQAQEIEQSLVVQYTTSPVFRQKVDESVLRILHRKLGVQ